jgi:transposase
MKGALARLGIRNFRPTLRNAAEHLAGLYTPEGSPLPPNVAAELERDIARLGLVIGQIKQIEQTRRQRLEEQPESRPHAMVRLLVRVVGIGTETADMLVNEVLSRPMRDRRAVARYAGLTGAPDESGAKRREQGLAKAGNVRVRRGMIPLAWRLLCPYGAAGTHPMARIAISRSARRNHEARRQKGSHYRRQQRHRPGHSPPFHL